MRIAGRYLAPELIERLKQDAGSTSRRQLARRLCEEGGWRSPSGRPALMSARKALAHLTRVGLLPPPVHSAPPSRQVQPPSPVPEPITTSLEALEPLEVLLVPPAPSSLSRQWNQWLDQFHPLGAGPLCGAQLRYLVRGANGDPVAALAFSAAAWQLAGRDCWIGWSPESRRQNLHRVVNNSRLLIAPHLQVHGLATHVLSQVLARLAEDWRARYGYPPVLVETFVERGRFDGGCYRAANWQAIAITQGRGRQDGAHRATLARKAVWVYPLQKDFRRQLREVSQEPRLPPLPPPPPAAPVPPPADWAEEELGQADLGDRRLVKRGCQLARSFYSQPQAQLPEACGSRAATKAAYRFFDHPRVTSPVLLQSHYAATARRVASEAVVLAVQDTTSLNYSAHPAVEMLGLIGSEVDGPTGMLVHSTLAFNLSGTPLGLVDVQCWTRDPDDFGKKNQRYQLPLEAKESVRWLRSLEALERLQPQCPNTRLVSVGDREADIYELFVWATEKPDRPGLLVRAERERILSDEQGDLWAYVPSLPVVGKLELQVPRRGNRAARIACLEIRFAPVQLRAPKRKPGLGSVRVWAVLAREAAAPEGTPPLEWMLLTTLRVEGLDGAIEKLRWYAGRWGIEVFHRVLKSGCRIESRQLGGADRLEACLAIDLVVAWRIHHLTKLGREMPEVPCTVYFEEHEWKALVVHTTRNPIAPKEPPTLRQAMCMMAALGGFLGRKGDGNPGTQTLWRGMQHLDDLADMYLVMSGPQAPVTTVSSDREYG